MERKKRKYEPPLAYDLTHAVSDEVRAQLCSSGGTPGEATCKNGNLATAKCSTGIVAGATCKPGGTAVYGCKSGSVPNTGL
jgi:hypothetical protein